MTWIKRNLYFLIGTVVALGLLGAAGWYGYSKYQFNAAQMVELDKNYTRLKELGSQNPHPGDDKIDNIAAAKEQQKELHDFMAKCRKYFQRIPAIPDQPKVSGQDFTAALSQTIAQLQHEATNSSVALPNDFSFSFTAQRPLLTFSPGSLEPLSVQLGEVRAIASILFQAKVNSIEGIRRERVSEDDTKGPQTDYIEQKSVTNELAVITPYEVSFRCFSSELASVLSGLAASPYSLVVKTINIEQAPMLAAEPSIATTPPPAQQYQPPPQPTPQQKLSEEQQFRARYGLGPAGEDAARSRYGTPPPRAVAQPAPIPQPGVTPTGAAPKGGLPTVLDEKPLKVTIILSVIKPLPPKEK